MTQQIITKKEILGLRKISKIEIDNMNIANFYKKNDAKQSAIKEKIAKIKKQLLEEEAKLYHTEQDALNSNKWPTKLVATEGLAEEIDFFENIDAQATIYDEESNSSVEAYRDGRTGKWFDVSIGYPCDENGGPDESKKFFRKTEVEI